GPAKGLLSYVAKTKQPSDVYMIPIARVNPLVAEVPLDQFRLRTGAPLYVDWKSMPFSDRDVLEWDARRRAVQSVYAHSFRNCAEVAALTRAGVTHAVVQRGAAAPRCAGSRAVYG